jgi:peptidoglycan/LPS O-acetylase OafA/YrhL
VSAVSTERPTAPTKVGDRYPALDGLRALAVLCVVMTHIGFQTGETFRGSFGALLARLDFGVTIFFLLSGFLLYGPFVRAELSARPAPSVRGYLRNRALRVLPGYWVAVLVIVPVMASRFLTPGELADQLLLLQSYSVGHLLPGLTQMWSLGVEVAFYVALPLLALLGRRGKLRLLVAMAVVSVLWTLSTRGLGVPDPGVGGLWLPAYLDWFALGMGLAVLRAGHDLHSRWKVLDQVADAGGTCWAVAALLLWLTATPLGGPRGLQLAAPGEALSKHLLYGAAATFLLLPAVFGTDDRSPVRRFLESPPMRWLGKVSYGVFLWHLLVLELVFRATGFVLFEGHLLLVTLLVIPGSLLVAALSLRLVEKPALALKRRWTTAGR